MRGLGLVAVLFCVALVLGQSETGKKPSKGKLLSPPVPRKCSARPKRFKYQGHNYFYSGDVAPYKKIKYDWLDGRNFCREYCMDLVSLETQQENDYIQNWLDSRNLTYTWTSGRLCDFDGCDRPDLQPISVKGWFWTGSNKKIAPTNQINEGWDYKPWSNTGHLKKDQPDNAEFGINNTTESCLALLNNLYNDGVKWHDVACYHRKHVLCEDSETLLDYVKATNEGIKL